MGDFSSIHELSLESKLIKEKDIISFLNKRYENIEHTYGISIRLREDEIKSISWIIEKQKNWDLLKKLGELGMKLYPESV